MTSGDRWEFVTNDEWTDGERDVIEAIADQVDAFAAGAATINGRDDSGKLTFIASYIADGVGVYVRIEQEAIDPILYVVWGIDRNRLPLSAQEEARR